ncbi:MAG: hypothetical protein U5N86_00980 [Planctomycetota bacterium]|nr:hypothetical protein [Planctomycetota bacterium]
MPTLSDVARSHGGTHTCCALDKGERGDVYNIASGQVYSIGEIVEELKGISGLDFPVRHETQIGISDLLHHFVGDGQKFRNATGWEPRIGLSQTLRDTYQHWLDNLPHT